jgi:predicted small secreted protein
MKTTTVTESKTFTDYCNQAVFAAVVFALVALLGFLCASCATIHGAGQDLQAVTAPYLHSSNQEGQGR